MNASLNTQYDVLPVIDDNFGIAEKAKNSVGDFTMQNTADELKKLSEFVPNNIDRIKIWYLNRSDAPALPARSKACDIL